jgi:hypothetical protein
MSDDTPSPLNNVITIDDERIKSHLDRVVWGTVEDTLNALLDAEADRPFDDSVPPSNVAVIVFPPTGDRPGRNSVAFVMVSGASCWSRTILFRQ